MYQLVYISSADWKLSASDLRDILVAARARNAANGISGLLLYAEGNFIQVLEGERSVVEALYGKITADPRHRNVTRVHASEIPRRVFGGWAMGYAEMTPADAIGRDVFRLSQEGLEDRLPKDAPCQVVALLRSFAKVGTAHEIASRMP